MTDKTGHSISSVIDVNNINIHDHNSVVQNERIIFSSPLAPGMTLNPYGNESLSDIIADQNLVDFSADVEKSFQNEPVAASVNIPVVPAKAKSVKTTRGYGPKKNVQRKRFHCTVENCQYSTPYSKDLARHMRKHTGEKPYLCPKCSKTFSRYDKLKTHMMTHAGVRPYKCDICSYASVDSGSLRKHLRTHTNERPYKCQLCPYQARDSSQLVVHLRHHTGDTPYICTHKDCKAAFKTPSDLQRHFRLHTGEKPYACPNCKYRAAVKCNLTVHIKKVHKDRACDSNGEVVLLVSSAVDSTSATGADSPILKDTYLRPIDSLEELHNFKGATDSNLEEQSHIITLTNADTRNETIIINSNPQLTPAANSTKPRRRAPRKKSSQSKTIKLPFQYACKSCTVKCDTIQAFNNHVVSVHKDSDILHMVRSLEAVIVNSNSAPAKKRVLKTEVAKLFDCNFCSASFARDDSLRCHLRQHNLAATRSSSTLATVLASPSFPSPAAEAVAADIVVLPRHHADVMNIMDSSPQTLSVSHSPFNLSTSDLSVNFDVLNVDNFSQDLVPSSMLSDSGVNSLAATDLPLVLRSETAMIDGQTQKVYVIVRNGKVPENK